MKSITAILLLLACAACSAMDGPVEPIPATVDIGILLANPAAYGGKLVQIRGASVARFEAEYICPSIAQLESDRSKECLWLAPGIGEGLAPHELAKLHNKLVVVVGRFKIDFLGHGGAYGGTIVPIKVQIVGEHDMGDIPPPPPEPSANNSFKPMPLRGAA